MDFNKSGVGNVTTNITREDLCIKSSGVMQDVAYGIRMIEYLICYKEVSL